MPTKIFVGNIALETSRELLMPLFQRYGQVTECDVLGSYGFVVSAERRLLTIVLHGNV
jgi:RNA recognition motif. (a.k.a. RRM, RBD, or RNP domain)